MVGILLLMDCAIPTEPYRIMTRLHGDMADITTRCRAETARTSISGMAFVIRPVPFPGAFNKDASINTVTNHSLNDVTIQGQMGHELPMCAAVT